MEYGYILLKNHNILNNIKYEVGKRYKFNSEKNFIYCHKQLNDIDNLWDYDKIYKIKNYDNDFYLINDFKILQEINYKKLLNSENENEQLISAIKNKEESVLDKLVSSDEYDKIMTIIKSGVYQYLDNIVKNKNEFIISYLIKMKGYNKYLDNLVYYNSKNIKIEIADVGRPTDLDILVYDEDSNVVQNVLLNGRIKDINKHIKDSSLTIPIIQTGIDKYLDLLKKTNEDSETFIERTKSIRKKDLDGYLKLNNHNFLRGIIKHGFDEHLNVIIKKELHFTFEYILRFERQKDIEFLTKKGYNISYYI